MSTPTRHRLCWRCSPASAADAERHLCQICMHALTVEHKLAGWRAIRTLAIQLNRRSA